MGARHTAPASEFLRSFDSSNQKCINDGTRRLILWIPVCTRLLGKKLSGLLLCCSGDPVCNGILTLKVLPDLLDFGDMQLSRPKRHSPCEARCGVAYLAHLLHASR